MYGIRDSQPFQAPPVEIYYSIKYDNSGAVQLSTLAEGMQLVDDGHEAVIQNMMLMSSHSPTH